MKSALVSGATSGIGLEIVKGLIGRNIHVYALTRTTTETNELTNWLSGAGKNAWCTPLQCDLRKIDEVERMLGLLESPPTIYALAAADNAFSGLEGTSYADADAILTVNLLSTWRIIKEINKKSADERYLLLFSSSSSLKPMPSQLAYHVSKCALNALFRSAYDELRNNNVWSCLVIPSSVNTRFWDGKTPAQKRGKFLGAEFVASAALDALFKKKKYCVLGLSAKLQFHLFQILPWSVTDWLVAFREKSACRT
ncbi:MAG: SDR family oxidoreductase [Elusimicrobiota bacterium]|nr:SDR family oxidoreductase [Elusimicrobiota bacterium]